MTEETNVNQPQDNSTEEITQDNTTNTTQESVQKTQPKKATAKTNTGAKTTQRKKRVKPDLNELVACRSVVDGGLTYKSKKSGTRVRWDNFGDEEYLEVGELVTMRSSDKKFLYEPWIIVEDDQGDVIEFLGLKKMYEDMIGIDEIENLFKKSPKKISELLKKTPSGIKETVASKARKAIENGDLYDLRVIGVLEKELGVQLKIFLDEDNE